MIVIPYERAWYCITVYGTDEQQQRWKDWEDSAPSRNIEPAADAGVFEKFLYTIGIQRMADSDIQQQTNQQRKNRNRIVSQDEYNNLTFEQRMARVQALTREMEEDRDLSMYDNNNNNNNSAYGDDQVIGRSADDGNGNGAGNSSGDYDNNGVGSTNYGLGVGSDDSGDSVDMYVDMKGSSTNRRTTRGNKNINATDYNNAVKQNDGSSDRESDIDEGREKLLQRMMQDDRFKSEYSVELANEMKKNTQQWTNESRE